MHLRIWLRLLVCSATLALVLSTSIHIAHAQSANAAAAEKAFNEARDHMKAGRYAQACPLLKLAQRLDPGMATEYRMAECYEKIGQLASASRHFRAVLIAAKAAGMAKRAEVAEQRLAEVQRHVPHIDLKLHPALIGKTNLRIQVAGADVDIKDGAQSVEVDAGDVLITAILGSNKSWRKVLPVENDSDYELTIPNFVESSPASKRSKAESANPTTQGSTSAGAIPPESSAVTTPGSGASALQPDVTGPDQTGGPHAGVIIGSISAALGVGGLATGAVLGLVGKDRYEDSQAPGICNEQNVCTDAGLAVIDEAQRMGNIGTGVFIGGAVLAAAGGGLLIWGLSEDDGASKPEPASVTLSLHPTGVSLVGRW